MPDGEHWIIPEIRNRFYPSPEMGTDLVMEFVHSRVDKPAVFATASVWNFNNRPFKEGPLFRVLNDLEGDRYVIPFGNPMLWSFIQHILPEELAHADYLVYSVERDMYSQIPNYLGRKPPKQIGRLKADICNAVYDGDVDVGPGGDGR